MSAVIAITGAAGGIGLACAHRFAADGCRLALTDRAAPDGLAALADEARRSGGELDWRSADLAQRGAGEAFVEAAERRFGRLDVLVTCAGILRYVPAHEHGWGVWDEVLAVNLNATWACVRAAVPGMRARGSGRIVTISSELGLIGLPGYAAYCASKGAVIALTKALAKELAPHGVLVNSIAPGPIETPMLVNSPEYDPAYLETLPIGRFGQPDEIARVVQFLAGPGGDYFVGQIVSPNGGAAI